jgi:hypothetical protein
VDGGSTKAPYLSFFSTTGHLGLLGKALDEAVEPHLDGALLGTSSSTPYNFVFSTGKGKRGR